MLKCARQGMSFRDQVVVCVITGSGLKDPETATKAIAARMVDIPADLASAERILGF